MMRHPVTWVLVVGFLVACLRRRPRAPDVAPGCEPPDRDFDRGRPGPPAGQAVKSYPVRVTGADIEIEG
jgi:hypothetical protein